MKIYLLCEGPETEREPQQSPKEVEHDNHFEPL